MNHVVHARATSQLSRVVALTQQGEDVTTCNDGNPVAKLVPIKPQRVFGLIRDKLPQLPLSAFAPMSDEEAAEWGL